MDSSRLESKMKPPEDKAPNENPSAQRTLAQHLARREDQLRRKLLKQQQQSRSFFNEQEVAPEILPITKEAMFQKSRMVTCEAAGNERLRCLFSRQESDSLTTIRRSNTMN